MIDGLSQVGILMLLLLTGMETDLRLVRKSGWAAVAIALCGIAFPFACGFALGQFGPAALLGGAAAATGWRPRCSWARRCPSPPSRSWRWWCGK